MSEGEVVEQLVELTNLLLVATGVFFTILSVYVGALHYALQNETWFTRTLAFLFVSTALAMIMAAFISAKRLHGGLIERLREIEAEGGLTAAGRAALSNVRDGFLDYGAGLLTLHEAIVYLVWGVSGLVYLALVYLTFFYRWRPERPLPTSP